MLPFSAKTEKRTFGQGNSFHGLGKGVIMPHRRGGFCNLQVLHFTLPLNTCRKVAPKTSRVFTFSSADRIEIFHERDFSTHSPKSFGRITRYERRDFRFRPSIYATPRHFWAYRLFWHWLNAVFFLENGPWKIVTGCNRWINCHSLVFDTLI